MKIDEPTYTISVKNALLSNRGNVFLNLIISSVIFILVSLISTIWFHLAKAGYVPSIPYLYLFNLGGEKNVAAWGSGAMLFLSGLILLNNTRGLLSRDRMTNLGYFGLGCVLIGLSADEIGSIHERINYIIPVINSLSSVYETLDNQHQAIISPILWEAPRLFFVILLFAMSAGLIFLLYRDNIARKFMYLVIIAFVLFLLVYLQEKFENHLRYTGYEMSTLQKILRLTVEEGTELIGMFLLLLFAILTKILRVEHLSELNDRIRVPQMFPFIMKNRGLFWVIVFIVGTMAILISNLLLSDFMEAAVTRTNSGRGVLAEWFFSMTYLLIFTVMILETGKIFTNFRAAFSSFLMLILSMSTVILSFTRIDHVKIYILIPILVISLLVFYSPRRIGISNYMITFCVLCAVLIVACCVAQGWLVLFVLEGIVAVTALGFVFANSFDESQAET